MLKVNEKGEYKKFYGWTCIAMVSNNLECIEKFIINNSVLSRYIAALPSSSYHMTVYNIWCNGSYLLAHQERNLKRICKSVEEMNGLLDESLVIGKGYFNPDGCIDELLYKLNNECDGNEWGDVSFKINKVIYNGNTMRISLGDMGEFSSVNKLRNRMISICERNDGMGEYHITLGYTYREVSREIVNKIREEVNMLNELLVGKMVVLSKAGVCCFSDMTLFRPFRESLSIN